MMARGAYLRLQGDDDDGGEYKSCQFMCDFKLEKRVNRIAYTN